MGKVKSAYYHTTGAVASGAVHTLSGVQKGVKVVLSAPVGVAEKVATKTAEHRAIRAARSEFRLTLIEEGQKILMAREINHQKEKESK